MENRLKKLANTELEQQIKSTIEKEENGTVRFENPVITQTVREQGSLISSDLDADTYYNEHQIACTIEATGAEVMYQVIADEQDNIVSVEKMF